MALFLKKRRAWETKKIVYLIFASLSFVFVLLAEN
jgi:hypothetical protein